MAIVNFLFGNRFASGFKVGGFQADMTLEETHEFIAEPTEFPVEDRQTATDSVIKSPKKLTLVGFVTETPAAPLSFFARKITDVFKTIEELYDKSEPLTVATSYKVYDNMLITRVIMPKNAPSSMEFTIELQEARIISPLTLSLGSLSPGVKDAASKLTDGGKQVASQASPQAAQQAASLLSKFFGG
jgi:hypothetical protein